MSSHVVTLRNAILEARAALTGATALTDLVPERSITFGNSPQKDRMPRIVIEVSGAEYDATFTQSRKVQTFTVEYAVYSKSVDTCTAIMDEVRQALDTYQSSDFAVRVTDESFQAEVDNVLLGVVVATFQDAKGIPGFDTSAAETLIAVQEDLTQAQTELAAWEAEFGSDLATYQATPAKIFYPSFLHLDNWRYGHPNYSDVDYPFGYDEQLQAGNLHAGPAPEKLLHVAALDLTDPTLAAKTLQNNNEFGNKHRFTYDDGTEATEVYSSTLTNLNSHALNEDGYTGSNPQYIIDNYTGLGWFRSNHGTATDGPWYTWRGTNVGTPPFSDYVGMLQEVDNLTLFGYSDWRLPSQQEFYSSMGPQDLNNTFGGNMPADLDPYFPPINSYWRGYGGRNFLLGPVDQYNQSPNDLNDESQNTQSVFSPVVPAVISNGAVIGLQSFSNANFFVSQGNNWNVFLVRRHFSNS